MHVWFVLEFNWCSRIQPKNQAHQVSFCKWSLQLIKVHGFNILLVQETFQTVFLQRRYTQISKGCFLLENRCTAQHLLGIDWNRLWITCDGMATHPAWVPGTTPARLHGHLLCLEQVCPTHLKCARLGLTLGHRRPGKSLDVAGEEMCDGACWMGSGVVMLKCNLIQRLKPVIKQQK